MNLHPAVENLIKFVNDEKKECSKENLNKWCAGLPKEEREFFLPKVKGGITREELKKILEDMSKPGPKSEGIPQPTPKKNVPSTYKKGDVLMHPIFQHPYILLEQKEGMWLCGLITSEKTCTEILEPCKSRFFEDGFFTRTIFTTTEPIGRFMYTFENARQVNSLLKKLKSIFK
jgi:hypothetical protein